MTAVRRRVNISDLAEGAQVDEVFLVREGSLRQTRSGGLYIAATLADASGRIPLRAWDAREEQAGVFRAGAYARVRGRVETYQGALQLVADAFRTVEPGDVDPADFLPASEADPAELEKRLLALCDSVRDAGLRALLAAFFRDEEFMVRFRRAPAASEYHHACLGGLLEHSLAVAEAAAQLAGQRGDLDRDLLVAGALLHDVGKERELSSGPAAFDYTDEGRMLGHVLLGTMEVGRRAAAVGNLSPRTRLLLLHLVASHHGQREYGAPVLPCTPEALALHHLDNLDAKVRASREAAAPAGDPLAEWSEFRRMLGVRVCLRGREGGPGPEKAGA